MEEKNKKAPSEKEDEKKRKELVNKENKILNWIIFTIFIIFLGILAVNYFSIGKTHFKYNSLEFKKIKKGNIYFYESHINVTKDGQILPYYFYLRTNIDDLKKIPFENESNFNAMKFNIQDLQMNDPCDGDTNIALLNLKLLHDAIGAKYFKDENATCDPQGRYNYYTIKKGNVTKINEISPRCYVLTFKDCEILDVTERLMITVADKYNSN